MTNTERFKLAEAIVRPVSWLTLAALPALTLIRHFYDYLPPIWLNHTLQVLTAAAVGYLTNFVAIEMLFRPYSPSERHWLRLFFWRQGLIPANKKKIGQVLGEEIPRNLLKPEELAQELGTAATELLQDEETQERFREMARRFLQHRSQVIANAVTPWAETALRTAIKEKLTPDNLRDFCDKTLTAYFSTESNRQQLAGVMTTELRKYAPEITVFLHENLKEGVRDYLRSKLRLLPGVGIPADLAAGLVDFLDWAHIEQQIAERLGRPELQERLRNELMLLSARLKQHLETPEGERQLAEFLHSSSHALDLSLRNYLRDHLPELTNRLLSSDELWDFVRNNVLPNLQGALLHYLRRGGNELIVAKLNLSERIERSVEAQDVREFHAMLNKVAEEHLVAIQVLGYLLGAAAGFLLILTNF